MVDGHSAASHDHGFGAAVGIHIINDDVTALHIDTRIKAVDEQGAVGHGHISAVNIQCVDIAEARVGQGIASQVDSKGAGGAGNRGIQRYIVQQGDSAAGYSGDVHSSLDRSIAGGLAIDGDGCHVVGIFLGSSGDDKVAGDVGGHNHQQAVGVGIVGHGLAVHGDGDAGGENVAFLCGQVGNQATVLVHGSAGVGAGQIGQVISDLVGRGAGRSGADGNVSINLLIQVVQRHGFAVFIIEAVVLSEKLLDGEVRVRTCLRIQTVGVLTAIQEEVTVGVITEIDAVVGIVELEGTAVDGNHTTIQLHQVVIGRGNEGTTVDNDFTTGHLQLTHGTVVDGQLTAFGDNGCSGNHGVDGHGAAGHDYGLVSSIADHVINDEVAALHKDAGGCTFDAQGAVFHGHVSAVNGQCGAITETGAVRVWFARSMVTVPVVQETDSSSSTSHSRVTVPPDADAASTAACTVAYPMVLPLTVADATFPAAFAKTGTRLKTITNTRIMLRMRSIECVLFMIMIPPKVLCAMGKIPIDLPIIHQVITFVYGR